MRIIRYSIIGGIALALALGHPADAANLGAEMKGDKAIITILLDTVMGYSARIAGGSLIIRFDEPADVNESAIKAAFGQLVSDAVQSADKKTIIVGLNYPVLLDHKRDDKEIIITLMPDTPANAKLAAVSADNPVPKTPPKPLTGPAEGSPKLAIRAAAHKQFFRIVFDWPDKIEYEFQQTENDVTLQFNNDGIVEDADLAKISFPKIASIVPAHERGKLKIMFKLSEATKVKHFIKNNSVVVDFYGSSEPPPVAAPTKTESTAPVDPKTESKFPLPQSERDPKAEQPPTVAEQVNKPIIKKADGVDDPSEIIYAQLMATRTDSYASLTFRFPKPTALSVFTRAGYNWIVFDRPSKLQMDKETSSIIDILGGFQIVDHPGATVLKLPVVKGLEPSVTGDSNQWQIDFKTQKLHPNIAITADYKDIGNGHFGLFLALTEAGRIFAINDSEVGDQIFVTTVHAAAKGVNGERDFPEFKLLMSLQGIAVVSKIDSIQVKPDFEGVVVSATKGLLLSVANRPQFPAEASEVYGPFINGTSGNPFLLKYAEWRGDKRKSFFEKERALLEEIGKIPIAERNEKRMDLAKLYFSYGWMGEALAVMRVMSAADESVLKSNEFLAIRAVASVMEHDNKQAMEDLKDQRFDEQADIATWRAVMASQQNDWSTADQYFSMSDLPNPDLPPNARKLAGLSKLESEIYNNHIDQAKNIIEQMKSDDGLTKTKDILDYWSGEIALRENNAEKAEKIWRKVVKNEDPYARPRAEFALIKLGSDNGTLKRDEVIARLERLRFAWRGDKFEFNVLRQLGSMQIEDGLYREGLFTLRRAVTNYADQPYVTELTELMTGTFKKLFMDGAADNMPPLTALGLFDEFRDLTPTGPDGDKIIQRLADRLITVDLLERAADLLSHQINYRLTGEDKARVGSKLAFVYLMDRKPEEAIKSIDLSNAPQMPPELISERRLLRGRALFDLGKSQEALDFIAQEKSQESDMLRADIYWRMRNWPMVSAKLQRLIAENTDDGLLDAAPVAGDGKDAAANAKIEPKPLSPQVSGWVLSMAVSTALSGDAAALKMIRRDYYAKMKPTPQFDAFDIITQINADEPLSLNELTGKLEQATKIESFMTYYKEKMKKGGLGGAQ